MSLRNCVGNVVREHIDGCVCARIVFLSSPFPGLICTGKNMRPSKLLRPAMLLSIDQCPNNI